MRLEMAVDLSLADVGAASCQARCRSDGRAHGQAEGTAPLSRREWEVAFLIADWLSNNENAERLVIAVGPLRLV